LILGHTFRAPHFFPLAELIRDSLDTIIFILLFDGFRNLPVKIKEFFLLVDFAGLLEHQSSSPSKAYASDIL
jgi:hypothetical protein